MPDETKQQNKKNTNFPNKLDYFRVQHVQNVCMCEQIYNVFFSVQIKKKLDSFGAKVQIIYLSGMGKKLK